MADQPPLALRPFNGADRFAVNRWLNEAHVIAWFGSRAVADAEIALAQSSPSSLIRMIERAGTAIGYIQAVDAVMTNAHGSQMPAGSYLLAAFVGTPSERGKGVGAKAAALLRDELFQTTLASAVSVLVPVRNEAAVRALERERFRWLEIRRDDRLGPCWVLASERA